MTDSEISNAQLETAAKILTAAGWRDTSDVQWEGLRSALEELAYLLCNSESSTGSANETRPVNRPSNRLLIDELEKLDDAIVNGRPFLAGTVVKQAIEALRARETTPEVRVRDAERHAMRVAAECKDLDPTARNLLKALYERSQNWPRSQHEHVADAEGDDPEARYRAMGF